MCSFSFTFAADQKPRIEAARFFSGGGGGGEVIIDGKTIIRIYSSSEAGTSSFERAQEICKRLYQCLDEEIDIGSVTPAMIDDVAVGVVGEKPVFSVEPGDLAGTDISPLILAYDWSNRLRVAFKAPLIQQYIVDEIVKIEKMKGIKVEVRKLKWGRESEILINGKVVMKTEDTDPDITPYDRARMIAQRIEESIMEGHEGDNVSTEIMPGGYYGVKIGGTAISLVSRQDAEARETKLWNLAVEYVNNIRDALGMQPMALGGISTYLSQTGRASWYGGFFHGRRTSNGEKYNMYDLTAAHRTLPFGTRVLVTRLDNYKSVAVRITDRGPFIRGRIIDLSRSAAEELQMLGKGVARVKIEVLDKPVKKKKVKLHKRSAPRYYQKPSLKQP